MKRESSTIAAIFRNRHVTLERGGGSMFDVNILNDLSCKHFKATTFDFPPITTAKVLDNGIVE